MSCKLTGAGGGGCAITLLPLEDSVSASASADIPSPSSISLSEGLGEAGTSVDLVDASGALVCDLKSALAVLGFETFESSLAGRGVQWI